MRERERKGNEERKKERKKEKKKERKKKERKKERKRLEWLPVLKFPRRTYSGFRKTNFNLGKKTSQDINF